MTGKRRAAASGSARKRPSKKRQHTPSDEEIEVDSYEYERPAPKKRQRGRPRTRKEDEAEREAVLREEGSAYRPERDMDTWREADLQLARDIKPRLQITTEQDKDRLICHMVDNPGVSIIAAWNTVKPKQMWRSYTVQVSKMFDKFREMAPTEKSGYSTDYCIRQVEKVLNELTDDPKAKRDVIGAFKAIMFITSYLHDQEKAHGDHFSTADYNPMLIRVVCRLLGKCEYISSEVAQTLLKIWREPQKERFLDADSDTHLVDEAIEKKLQLSRQQSPPRIGHHQHSATDNLALAHTSNVVEILDSDEEQRPQQQQIQAPPMPANRATSLSALSFKKNTPYKAKPGEILDLRTGLPIKWW